MAFLPHAPFAAVFRVAAAVPAVATQRSSLAAVAAAAAVVAAAAVPASLALLSPETCLPGPIVYSHHHTFTRLNSSVLSFTTGR